MNMATPATSELEIPRSMGLLKERISFLREELSVLTTRLEPLMIVSSPSSLPTAECKETKPSLALSLDEMSDEVLSMTEEVREILQKLEI